MGNRQAKFLALLRGVNVGGKNRISQEALRQAFESLGCRNVRTYIHSGNILFRSDKARVKDLAQTIEQELSARFAYAARAVVFPYDTYTSAVDAAPDDWGKNDEQQHNALFLLGDIRPEAVAAQLPPPKKAIETVTTGPRVLFWSVSKRQLTKTTFMKLPIAPVYQHVTVRNHKTVFTLLELFEEM